MFSLLMGLTEMKAAQWKSGCWARDGELRVLSHLDITRLIPIWDLHQWLSEITSSMFSIKFLGLTSKEFDSRSLGWSPGIFVISKHPSWVNLVQGSHGPPSEMLLFWINQEEFLCPWHLGSERKTISPLLALVRGLEDWLTLGLQVAISTLFCLGPPGYPGLHPHCTGLGSQEPMERRTGLLGARAGNRDKLCRKDTNFPRNLAVAMMLLAKGFKVFSTFSRPSL